MATSPPPARNGRTVAVLLLLVALLPMAALVLRYPSLAGPPVAVFVLTGVLTIWWNRRRDR